MRINFHIEGINVSEAEKTEMEEKIKNLEKYVREPAVADVYIVDESGKQSKNGFDQKVKLGVLMGKEKIFIEKLEANHIQAFNKAYHRLKTNLEDFHSKLRDKEY
jgi:ribosome-associated translation inhibitor RaiA